VAVVVRGLVIQQAVVEQVVVGLEMHHPQWLSQVQMVLAAEAAVPDLAAIAQPD
jgi:hypothetical protein